MLSEDDYYRTARRIRRDKPLVADLGNKRAGTRTTSGPYVDEDLMRRVFTAIQANKMRLSRITEEAYRAIIRCAHQKT